MSLAHLQYGGLGDDLLVMEPFLAALRSHGGQRRYPCDKGLPGWNIAGSG